MYCFCAPWALAAAPSPHLLKSISQLVGSGPTCAWHTDCTVNKNEEKVPNGQFPGRHGGGRQRAAAAGPAAGLRGPVCAVPGLPLPVGGAAPADRQPAGSRCDVLHACLNFNCMHDGERKETKPKSMHVVAPRVRHSCAKWCPESTESTYMHAAHHQIDRLASAA